MPAPQATALGTLIRGAEGGTEPLAHRLPSRQQATVHRSEVGTAASEGAPASRAASVQIHGAAEDVQR